MRRVLSAVTVAAVALAGVALLAPPAMAAPANDDFDDATVIGALPFIDRIDTSTATSAPDDPSCHGSDASVWYAFTPSQDVYVQATTVGSRYDTTLSAWTGERGDLDLVACNDDASGGLHSQITFAASAGTTYHLMVAAFEGGQAGIMMLSAYEVGPPPANDDFDQATPIPALPFTDALDSVDATTAPDDPDCAGDASTVWYAFTPERSTLVEAHTFGSDFDTTLSAWTGERGDLELVACNDDRGDDVQSQILFVARAGVTYHLMAGAFGGGLGGALALSVGERRIDETGLDCPTQTWGFDDVPEGGVHADAIRCGIYLDVVRGFEDGLFRPAMTVRRDQMASLLARALSAAGVVLPEPDPRFTDVADNVHADAIGRLAAAGIVRGTAPATYSPARTVTRDQLASQLVRTLEWVRGTTLEAPASPFVDIVGNAHQAAIDVAYAEGLTTGRTATTYAPRLGVRRDQAATFMIRLLPRLIDD